MVIFLLGLLTNGCDDKQESDYRVNATIMPDDDGSHNEGNQ